MATYKGTIQDRRGRIVKTEVVAMTEIKAREILTRRGKIISGPKKKILNLEELVHLTPGERQTFLRNLATLLASQKGASDALRAIEYSFKGTIKRISGRLLNLLENGTSLIDALHEIGKKEFPDTTLALIRAGERSGKTWKALQDAADFEMEMEEMKRGSNKQLWVAMGGFAFAVATVFGTTEILAPAFLENSFMEMLIENVDLRIVDAMTFMTQIAMGIFGGAFFILFFLATVGKKLFPFIADKIILKIPIYNSLVLSKNNYITLYGLSLMMTAGVSMERALNLAQQSAAKGALKKDLQKASEAVKKGSPWSKEMTTFSEVDKAALEGAVDKSQISNILHHLARNNRETYKQVAATIGPVLQLLAAFFIIMSGAILFGYTMLPMLQASAGI
jgi:general secretion pathway protein F